jgi:hypothetical protein
MAVRLILVFSLVLLGFDQPKLVKMKLDDGTRISIPEGWRPMDDMDFRDRYPSVRAPIGAFTNEERLVDFSVNISATRWPDTDQTLAQQFFKSSIMNMFDKVTMIDEGTRELHGKKFIFFEFESRINGNRQKEGEQNAIAKYSYIQYYVGKDRTLVFSFNCPQRAKVDWQGIAKQMMLAIRVK